MFAVYKKLKKMKKVIFASILTLSIATCFAIEGMDPAEATANYTEAIEGKIIDKTTGESLAGVALVVDGSAKKYYTDLDGNFSIGGIAPGIHNIDILYVSYQGITLKDISTQTNELKLKVELESVSPNSF